MAWQNGVTWLVGVVPHSSDLNQYVRDNFNAIYNILTASPYKFGVERQGGDPNNWQTAGTNNYAPTDAYIQCGMVATTISSGVNNGTVTVTLPTALSASASAIAWACDATNAATMSDLGYFPIISGSTALVIAWSRSTTSFIPAAFTANIAWGIIGR